MKHSNKLLVGSLLAFSSIGTSLLATTFNDTYVSAQISNVNVENKKFLNAEPLANIVGGDHKRLTIYLGVEEDNFGFDSSKKGDLKVCMFIYGALSDGDKNNEYVGGVGAKIESRKFWNKIRLTSEFKAGLGKQSVEGDKLNLQTNVNVGNYAYNGYKTRNYTGTYTKDTQLVEFSIGIGLSYDLSESITIDTNYNYIQKNYDFSYLVDGFLLRTEGGGVVQDNHEFGVALNYKF